MINSEIFVFDIETIPDLELAQKVLGIEDFEEQKILKSLANYHNPEYQDINKVFFKPIFHKIVAISFAKISIDHIDNYEHLNLQEIRSGGNIESSEEELVKGFFKYIENHSPRIVSYNGRAFDLPVLKYRALKYQIGTNIYKLGDKWNNYMQRYSSNWHCDLHEILTDYYASGRAKLDEIASLMGYPGKLDVDGSTVFDLYKKQKIGEIRDYCETDVLNTYLIYLNYALHYGIISKKSHCDAIDQINQFLDISKQSHWKKFKKKLDLKP